MIVVAIDGPAGSGKSTVAKNLSTRLDFEYLDSGAIYRTFTLFGMSSFGNIISGYESEIALYFTQNPEAITIVYENHSQKMLLNGEDVSRSIRDIEVTRQIKFIADDQGCRDLVNKMIRNLADKYSVVIDGRDIGTKVFPDTPFKFYLDAKPETRAIRRGKELGIPSSGEEFDKLLNEIVERDRTDMNRKIAPLCIAENAILIDTTELSVNQVVASIVSKLDLKP